MPEFSQKKVYVFGASGSGTTTLAAQVAARTGLVHLDSDDRFWAQIEPPFSHKNTPADRLASLSRAAGDTGWVLSGACHGWGAEVVDQADLIVFVALETEVRLRRLIARERARFGSRIEPGGDMFQIHTGFLEWARGYDRPDHNGRNLAMHEQWLAQQIKPILRIHAAQPVETLADKVIAVLSRH